MLFPESGLDDLAGALLAHRILLVEIMARLSQEEIAEILQSARAYSRLPDFGDVVGEQNPARLQRIQRNYERELRLLSENID